MSNKSKKRTEPTKENIEYWKKRYEDLQLLTEKNSESFVENVGEQFRIATMRIKRKLDRFYMMFADNEDIDLQEAKKLLNSEELEEFHMSIEEYIELMDEYDKTLDEDIFKKLQRASLKFRVTRLEAIELQLMGEVIRAYTGVDSAMFNVIENAYIDRYYRSIFTIFQGFGIGVSFSTIDRSALELLLDKPWTADGSNFSSRVWRNRRKLIDDLSTELTQALISGYSYTETSERLARKMKTEVSKCDRIVTTESAFFSSIAQQESWNELEVEQYQVVATLDSVTSDICRHQDLKVFDMKDFKPGETAPPFHVHCRTTTTPYFDDSDIPGYIVGKRAARNELTGKTYYVPADMNYLEWEEKYVKNANKKEE